jgi:hypothetical protein
MNDRSIKSVAQSQSRAMQAIADGIRRRFARNCDLVVREAADLTHQEHLALGVWQARNRGSNRERDRAVHEHGRLLARRLGSPTMDEPPTVVASEIARDLEQPCAFALTGFIGGTKRPEKNVLRQILRYRRVTKQAQQEAIDGRAITCEQRLNQIAVHFGSYS